MNSFVWNSNHCLNSLKVWSFGSPISWGSWTIFSSTNNNSLWTLLKILFSSIINGHNFFIWDKNCMWTFLSLHHSIFNSNICKCSSYHNFIISSSCPISIKIFLFNSSFFKISTSRTICRNIASRTNMICCNWISKNC